MSRSPHHLTWLWAIVWAAVVFVAFRACVYLVAERPFNDVRPYEVDYPQLNPRAAYVVNITGAMPAALQISLTAEYQASNPQCFRSMPLGPSPPLHLSEILPIIRVGLRYRSAVVVDKYLPGRCAWRIAWISYEDPRSSAEYRENRPGWHGEPVIYFRGDADKSAAHSGKVWTGPINIWCTESLRWRQPEEGAACGPLAAFGGYSNALEIPPADSGTEVATWVLENAHYAEVNFRDLDSWPRPDAESK